MLLILWIPQGFNVLGIQRTPEQIFLSLTGKAHEYSLNFVTFQSENDQCGQSLVEYSTNMLSLISNNEMIKVKYGKSLKGYTYGIPMNPMTLRRTHHLVLINNIRPLQQIFYRVGTENCGRSTIFNFTMIDSIKKHGRFCLFADLDNDHAIPLHKYSPLDRINDLKTVPSKKCEYILSIGDISYNIYVNKGTWGDAFFRAIQRVGTHTPFVFVIGDHEWNKRPSVETSYRYEIFEQIFQTNQLFHQYHQHFFSFDIQGIHFLVLNTDRFLYRKNTTGVDPRQYPPNDLINEYPKWVENNLLAINQTQTPLTIVLGHRSIYCHKSLDSECNFNAIGSEPLQLRNKLENLFFKNDVSLIFSGHTHHYERSWPVFHEVPELDHSLSSYINPKAPTYIVSGIAGNGEDIFKVDPPDYNAVRDSTYSPSLTTVNYEFTPFQRKIYLEQITNQDGKILDQLSITYDNR